MGCCSSNNYGLLKDNVDEIELDESNEEMIDKLIIGYIRASIQDSLPHDIEKLILYFFGRCGVDGDLIITNNSTLILGENRHQKYQFGSIQILENGTLKCAQHDPLFITCFGNVIIEKGAKIDLNGMGYLGGKNWYNGESYKGKSRLCCCCPNYGGGGGSCCGDGGGGGGYGECGDCHLCCCLFCGLGGCTYGDKELTTLHVGSGGGGGDEGRRGGNGGGAIRLQCFGRILLKENARITCNGEDGKCYGSGGSGGSIHIVINDTNKLQIHRTSMISAKGGRGHKNGGDGRIRIELLMRNKILSDKYNVFNIRPDPYIG